MLKRTTDGYVIVEYDQHDCYINKGKCDTENQPASDDLGPRTHDANTRKYGNMPSPSKKTRIAFLLNYVFKDWSNDRQTDGRKDERADG